MACQRPALHARLLVRLDPTPRSTSLAPLTTTTSSLATYSIAIVAIAFAFEALRFRIAAYERQVAAQLLQQARRPDGPGSSSGRSSPAVDAFPLGGV